MYAVACVQEVSAPIRLLASNSFLRILDIIPHCGIICKW